MSKTTLRLLLILLLQMLGGTATAAPPATLGYQGNLANAGGIPVTGDFTITFRLYDTATSGVALWTEVQPNIDVDGGNLFVELGRVAPLPANIWGRQLYLGLQVAGDTEMTPRPALTASPYALRAAGTMKRTIVVSAEGTPTQNGAALLAAVAAITDANADSPVTVDVDSGTFDLGAATLVVPSHTALAGRGQVTTVITSAAAASPFAATVQLSANSGARDFTARNTGVPPGADDSAIGLAAYGADPLTPVTEVQIARVTGESIAAMGSAGQRSGITLCASNTRATEITATAQGGLFAMAMRATCGGTVNLGVDGATLHADAARDGVRGAYLVAGSGNYWRRMQLRLGVSPSVVNVYGLRFFAPGSFGTELQGKLSDTSITIRGGNLATPTSTGRLEGITLEDSAQLALIEDVSVHLDRVRAAGVIGVRLLERTNNTGTTARLVDVDVRVTALQDAALGFGEIVGVRAEGYPPELVRTQVSVNCVAGGFNPCIGIAQPESWTSRPGTLLLTDSSVSAGHAAPADSSTRSAALQVMGPTRIERSGLRVTESAQAEPVRVVRHLASTAVTQITGSSLVATNAANSNSLCLFEGPSGASGEWFGNHVQGSRCDGGQVNLTCAGTTKRGSGFLAATCP